MRRRLNPYFTALMLVLMLTLSYILVPIALSQNSEKIRSKLRELQEDVSALPLDEAFENTHAARGQRKALTNKIKAVIHQIEAGAYKGALNKLENDLKNAVEAWITDEFEASLIEKIDEIIRLIKGEQPPPPFPDFVIEASPASLTIAQGASDISIITITSLNGFKKTVDLMVSDVPLGATAILNPEQVTPPADGIETSTLTVSVDLSATPGTYFLTVTGTSNSRQHSTEVILEIVELPPPDFSIEANPAALTIEQGGSDTSTIAVTSINGFNQAVDLAVTSTPIAGVTASLDPVQVTPPVDGSIISTLEIDVDLSAVSGSYTLTVTGTSGALQHGVEVDLEVTLLPPSPDFSIEASPLSLQIQQGGSGTSTITVTSLNGFNLPVDLSVTSVIQGVTATLDQATVTPPSEGSATATLTVEVDVVATQGTYTLTVTGTGDTLERSADISLEVTELPPTPDFAVSSSLTLLTIFQGDSAASTITVTSLNGFGDAVDLSVLGVPMGVTATFDPAQVTPPVDNSITSTLTINADTSAAVGAYTLTVKGTSGALQREVDIELTVAAAPDFSMTAYPTSLAIQQGDSGSATIVVISVNGFSASVDLTVTSLSITGVTTILNPSQVTPPADALETSTLTVQVDESATAGTYTLTVTGTSGSLSRSVDIEVEVTTVPPSPPSPDFSVTVHPSSLSRQQGASDTASIIVASLHGFSNLVSLTVSPTIDGITFSLDPTSVTPTADGIATSTLTITITETATPSSHLVTLTGTSGALQHSASLSLEITTTPPPLDTTPPTVRIDEPANESYVAGLVDVVVFVYDEHFRSAELTINNIRLASWIPENVSTGEHSVSWDTTLPEYPDGFYIIKLTAEDEAGNSAEISIMVLADNTKPTIEVPTWKPEEPSVDTQVNVTVKVTDPQPSSGVRIVTLWYKNTTMLDWQPILMSLDATTGNWTATIPAQSVETTIEFYIEAFDYAGNKAMSETYEYEVLAPAGVPLAWIVAIILLILVATVAAIYLWRKRKKEKQILSGSGAKNYKLTLFLCF